MNDRDKLKKMNDTHPLRKGESDEELRTDGFVSSRSTCVFITFHVDNRERDRQIAQRKTEK